MKAALQSGLLASLLAFPPHAGEAGWEIATWVVALVVVLVNLVRA